MTRSRSFFHSLAADELALDHNHPPGIRAFLRTERTAVNTLVGELDLLIEVACGEGTYLPTAVDHGTDYLGIDMVSRHVAAGQRRVSEEGLPATRFRFVQGDAHRLSSVVARERPDVLECRSAVLFPFSILSALEPLERVAAELAELRVPFLATLYRSTPQATASRMTYYRRCGYTGIEMSTGPEGVRLSTASGLTTLAFRPGLVEDVFRRHGLKIATRALSPLLVLHVSPDLPYHDQLPAGGP